MFVVDRRKRDVAVCGVAHPPMGATHFVLQLNRILNKYFRLMEEKRLA